MSQRHLTFHPGRMTNMAGRPKKDPSGGKLEKLSMSVVPGVRTAIEEAAREYGVYEVDYISALVAADRQRRIPGVPDLTPSLLRGELAS